MTLNSAHDTRRLVGGHDRSVTRQARQRLLHEHKTRSGQRAAIEGAARYGADELTIAQLAAVRLSLEEIDAALVRLDHGSYGICERCGRPIPAERLDILPHTRFCVGCQRRYR
jgi:RNA polymerase-binding transcription factor